MKIDNYLTKKNILRLLLIIALTLIFMSLIDFLSSFNDVNSFINMLFDDKIIVKKNSVRLLETELNYLNYNGNHVFFYDEDDLPEISKTIKIIHDENIAILSKDITLYTNNLASGLYSGNYVRAEGYSINLKIIYKALSSNDSKLYIDVSTLMSIAEKDKAQLCFSDKIYNKKGRILIGEIIVAKNGFQYSYLLLKKYSKKILIPMFIILFLPIIGGIYHTRKDIKISEWERKRYEPQKRRNRYKRK